MSENPVIHRKYWQGKPVQCRMHNCGQKLSVALDGAGLLHSQKEKPGQYTLSSLDAGPLADAALAIWLEYCFSENLALKKLTIKWEGPNPSTLLQAAHALPRGDYMEVCRERFYQLPWLWRRSREYYPLHLGHKNSKRPDQYVSRADIDITHPQRASKPAGWVYQRLDAEFNRHIAFRVVDPEADLAQFHQWQNQPRIARFWELAQDHQTLHRYLIRQQQDPHTLSLIGHLDGQAFGYFEVYWCQEDRLGAYYDASPYDRGWHALTGSRQHLGKFNTITWIKALCHYLFLDDPRTGRLMAEPRADNAAMLKYQKYVPYQHRGEFDFPHKRAALMQLDRCDFFQQVKL